MENKTRAYRARITELDDYEWCYRMFVIERHSTLEIAKILNCDRGTVSSRLGRYGITGPNPTPPDKRKGNNQLVNDVRKLGLTRVKWREMATS